MKGFKELLIASAIVTFASCGEKEQVMTQNEIDAKVDSTVATKIEELNKQAMEDLDRRQSIEVKAKADSIVEAYQKAQQPGN